MHTSDIVILGAGASGLTCAALAARSGHSVTILEGQKKAGRKILASGGGKCNITNTHITPTHYLSNNPHFCKSALSRYTQWDTLAMLERCGIAYEERDHGRVFCKRSAADVVQTLLAACRATNCQLHLRNTIHSVTYTAGRFAVTTSAGNFTAPALVIATGGPSWSQLGASDIGHHIAKQFGHSIISVQPALAPLIMPSSWPLHGLSGIALPVRITCTAASFHDALLFTHSGISGPAALQISGYLSPGDDICINFLPHQNVENLLRTSGKAKTRTTLGKFLPGRLIQHILHQDAPLLEQRTAELCAKSIQRIAHTIHHHVVVPKSTEGMYKAEAARGGVDTAQISSKTMESSLVPGLFFTGEVIDVTGQLGGYNLQWAWSSGYAAGVALASRPRTPKAIDNTTR